MSFLVRLPLRHLGSVPGQGEVDGFSKCQLKKGEVVDESSSYILLFSTVQKQYLKLTKWFTAKYGFPILVHTDLVPVNVVFVQTNMVLFESTDSVFADSVSVSMPTTSVSRSSSKRWLKCEVDEDQRNQKMDAWRRQDAV